MFMALRMALWMALWMAVWWPAPFHHIPSHRVQLFETMSNWIISKSFHAVFATMSAPSPRREMWPFLSFWGVAK